MIPDLAARVHDHSYRVDPIIRTLLDTDFYKFLMLQMIWKLKPEVHATFGLRNRSASVRLADFIDEKELIAQLDHARALRFQKNELIWLAGNSFYGKTRIFEPGFLDYLAEFRLPPYRLSRRDGEFELRFEGLWRETTMWEVPALAILNELRARAAMRQYGPLRTRRSLCAGQGQALEQDRAAAGSGARRAAPALRFRHAAPAWILMAALVRRSSA